MVAYKIYFRESVEKDFAAMPKRDLQRILQRIQALAEDPRPSGGEKLTGQEKYRIRQGRCRIVYSIQESDLTVWIVKVGHRKDIYR